MKRNKAKTKKFYAKISEYCEKRKRKLRSEQAKRMRNGSLFVRFALKRKKNISENRTP
jgi:hypothetical protein